MNTHQIKIPARKNTPETMIYAEEYCAPGKRLTVLMINGGPGNDLSTYNSAENSIAKAFSAYANVILFDPRGVGKSNPSNPVYCSLDEYINDIEEIRKYFNLNSENLIIFGQSYGAIAAIGYATKHNDKLKKLFLIGGVANGSFLKESLDDLHEFGTNDQKKYIDILWNGKFKSDQNSIRDFYETMGPLYAYTFKPGGPTPALTYNPEIMNYGFADFLKKFDYTDDLKNISIPTLILWGEDEWIFSFQQVDVVHQGIKNSELKIYEECSHLLWIDQWNRFLTDSINFIKN